MKKKFVFSTGEVIMADQIDLQALLLENQHYFHNYMDVFSNLDDEVYIALGNGFCETIYSEDFIEGQMAKYLRRVNDIRQWIEEFDQA